MMVTQPCNLTFTESTHSLQWFWMFAIVMLREVKKGQAMFLGYLLSNEVAARVKAHRTEQTALLSGCNPGRGVVVPTGSAAVADNPSRVFLS